MQELAVAALLLVVWLLLRPRRKWVPLVLVAVIAVHGHALRGLVASSPVAAHGPALRVLSFNTWPRNPATDAIWDSLAAAQPDVAILFEVSPELVGSRDALIDSYDVAHVDEFIVLVRHGVDADLDALRTIHHGVSLDVQHDGRALRLLAAHPLPSLNGRWARDSDRCFDGLVEECTQSPLPVVLVGDLNTTPWSTRFRDLLLRTPLVDTSRGRGWQPSFPTWPPVVGWPFGIPIDHALHDPALVCVTRDIGPDLGSNHAALELAFAWAR